MRSLRGTQQKQQFGEAFNKAFSDLSSVFENGFDIGTTDMKRVEDLENKYFVEMSEGSEELKLYRDNCVPLDGKCPRLMWSTSEIDEEWLAAAEDRLDKIEESQISAARKEEKVQKKLSEDRKREEIAAAFLEPVQSVLDDDLTEDFMALADKKKKVVQ